MVLWILLSHLKLSCTGLSPSLAGFPKAIPLALLNLKCSPNPCSARTAGLGSSGFARRYSRNRCFFLFLRLLRCFSSPGSPPYVMDWRTDDGGFLRRVSPFRYLRINGYLLLPEAFRSLSRLSSALSAKASTLRSSSLNLCNQPAKQDGCFPVRIALQTGGFGLFYEFLSCKQCLQFVACFI